MAEPARQDGLITYTAVLTPGEDGFVLAQIAEIPEAIGQGRTLDEAKANVIEALELALAWRRDEGESPPSPAEVRGKRRLPVGDRDQALGRQAAHS